MSAKLPALRRCFEEAGFANVKTVLSSGNVAFDARSTSEASLQRRAESRMQATFGRSFYTIVRRADFLLELLQADPYAGSALPARSKRVVSFLRAAKKPKVALPLRSDGAEVLSAVGREVFTSYVRSDKGAVFMKLIEKAFGSDITTRTWETVSKCAVA